MSEHEWEEWLDDVDPEHFLDDLAYQLTGEGFYALAPFPIEEE